MNATRKTTIDKAALRRLYAAPTFSPTDCPNYITYRDYEQYRWYARVLAPLLIATGGGPLFVGHRVAVLHGESPCETWMIVRYPTHRGMLRMILNPYYFFVANRFREKGTAKLELAFTAPRDPKSGLQRSPFALGLHVRAPDADRFFAAVRALAGGAGLDVVYESESRLSFDFIRDPRPFDPNPLTYPITLAIGAKSEEPLRAFAADPALRALLESQGKASAQLYARADKYEYLRFGAPRHRGA